MRRGLLLCIFLAACATGAQDDDPNGATGKGGSIGTGGSSTGGSSTGGSASGGNASGGNATGGQGGGQGGSGGSANCNLTAVNVCTGAEDLGDLPGDDNNGGGNTPITKSGTESKWFTVRITEPSFSSIDPSYTLTLDSGPNNKYFLFVHQSAISGGPTVECSGAGAQFTKTDTSDPGGKVVEIHSDSWTDVALSDEHRYLAIEVRHNAGTSCEGWTLKIEGHTGLAN